MMKNEPQLMLLCENMEYKHLMNIRAILGLEGMAFLTPLQLRYVICAQRLLWVMKESKLTSSKLAQCRLRTTSPYLVTESYRAKPNGINNS